MECTCPIRLFNYRPEPGNINDELRTQCVYNKCMWYQANESHCSIWILANVLKKELPKMTDELTEGK
jgi:hypothetical protein